MLDENPTKIEYNSDPANTISRDTLRPYLFAIYPHRTALTNCPIACQITACDTSGYMFSGASYPKFSIMKYKYEDIEENVIGSLQRQNTSIITWANLGMWKYDMAMF